MSRDFAKKSRAPARKSSSSKSQTPAWVWFIAGGILGAFAASLFFIKHPVAQDKPVKTEDKPKAQNNIPKPRFDFYKLLQDSETIVPASETTNAAEDKPAAEKSTTEYILQVGSFPAAEDADKLRAQLILLNLDARIEKVEIRKGDLWHRVVVGPFDSQAALTKARTTLVNNQYNALVLKRAKSK